MSGICSVSSARLLRRLLRAGGNKPWSRGYLSASYSCDDDWRQNIERCPEIAKLDKEMFFMELEKNFKNKQKVHPIDMEMFTVVACTDQDLDDLQNLTHRFRRSPNPLVLPSTSHALVRSFLGGSEERRQRLVTMLDDRVNYGVFLDYYTAVMLMDRFLTEKNYRDAAKVASQLMLQEEWQHPIAVSMALLSCLEYDRCRQPEPWNTTPQPEDDGETVYVRVDFLRNEWNDDHFDLSDPSQIIGKTLAWLSRDLLEQPGLKQFKQLQLVADSCQLLGWALYGKWEEVSRTADLLVESGRQVTEITKRRVLELLSPPANADEQEAAAAAAVSRAAVERLGEQPEDLLLLLTQLVRESVAEHSEQDRLQLQQLYSSWAERRLHELHVQREEEERAARIAALDQRRQQLREKERLLYFFDNEEEIRRDVESTWYKPVKPKPKAAYKMLRKKRDVQEDYVPPKVGEHSQL